MTIEYDVSCGFVKNGFYCIEICSPYTHTGEKVFIINECWILSNASSAAIETIMWFLSFLCWCGFFTLIDLWMLKHTPFLGMNSNRSWCMILFVYCYVWFANTLLRIIASIFIRCLPVIFSFSCYFFFVLSWFGFGIGVMVAL